MEHGDKLNYPGHKKEPVELIDHIDGDVWGVRGLVTGDLFTVVASELTEIPAEEPPATGPPQ